MIKCDRCGSWVLVRDAVCDNEEMMVRRTESWKQTRARIEGAHIWVCVDGARRGSGDSAAGVAIVAHYSGGTHSVVHQAGKLLGILSSAFVAEALALEWGLQAVARLTTE